MQPPVPFAYPPEYVRNYDGDSVTFHIDRGWSDWKRNVNCRLYGIDTPEMRGKSENERKLARLAKGHVEAKLSTAINITVVSSELDKYGRPLLEVYFEDESGWHHLNAELVSAGFAKEYDGTGPRPDWSGSSA